MPDPGYDDPGYEVLQEGLMPALELRYANRHQGAQVAVSEGIIAVVFIINTADYAGRKLVFRILSGAI